VRLVQPSSFIDAFTEVVGQTPGRCQADLRDLPRSSRRSGWRFRKQVARAELERQFIFPTASRLFGELTAGVN
jgi:hypothetical protein